MDIQGLLSNVKQGFISLFSKIKDYYRNNKKQSIIISVLLVLIIILFIILISILSGKKTKDQAPVNNIILTEKALIPSSPEVQENYTLSRESKDKWTTEESDEWFTVPGQKDIDSLSNTNDNLVSDIIEAAP